MIARLGRNHVTNLQDLSDDDVRQEIASLSAEIGMLDNILSLDNVHSDYAGDKLRVVAKLTAVNAEAQRRGLTP
jgi:hypothetical protein